MKTAKYGIVCTLWRLKLLTVDSPTKIRVTTMDDADVVNAFARTTCFLQLNNMPFPRDYQDYMGAWI